MHLLNFWLQVHYGAFVDSGCTAHPAGPGRSRALSYCWRRRCTEEKSLELGTTLPARWPLSPLWELGPGLPLLCGLSCVCPSTRGIGPPQLSPFLIPFLASEKETLESVRRDKRREIMGEIGRIIVVYIWSEYTCEKNKDQENLRHSPLLQFLYDSILNVCV